MITQIEYEPGMALAVASHSIGIHMNLEVFLHMQLPLLGVWWLSCYSLSNQFYGEFIINLFDIEVVHVVIDCQHMGACAEAMTSVPLFLSRQKASFL